MTSPNRQMGQRTRLTAICSVLSALSVVLLYLGSFVEVLDLSVALIASLAVVVLVIERGGIYPWMTCLVTSVLSLLLLPNKTPAIVYACFMGFYPILKEKIEKLRWRAVRIVLKLVTFNASVLLMWLVAQILVGELTLGAPVWIMWGLLNGVFIFYDYALSVLITSYLRVWRKRLRIGRFFEK